MKEEDKNIVIGALRACSQRSDIEGVFDKFDIGSDIEKRINFLVEAMGNPDLFFSTGNPTIEQRYELVIEMFLSMTWKFSFLCQGISF